MSDKTVRAFVALPLSEDTHRQLDRVQRRLQRDCPPGAVKWVSPEKIHLTLFFLGDVLVERIDALREALTVVARNAAPIKTDIGGLGVFPNPNRARVLWVGVGDPAEHLALLHLAVNEALAQLGYEPDRRPFHPHLTLGRVRRRTSRADVRHIGELVTRTEIGTLGRETFDEVVLFRSDLTPTGAEYMRLATFRLG
ncbi:MAG: RNA 2',3'-cyclic phosphodiesterase [Anaerolineae bacterium]